MSGGDRHIEEEHREFVRRNTCAKCSLVHRPDESCMSARVLKEIDDRHRREWREDD